ncbi:hypothetical protein ACTPL8_002826 [Enterococcus faecium]
MKYKVLKECVILLGRSNGITYDEFCFKGNASLIDKNMCLRFLVHQGYVFKANSNNFYLSELGNKLYKEFNDLEGAKCLR